MARRKADGSVGRESCCPALDASRDIRSAMIVQWVSRAKRCRSPAQPGTSALKRCVINPCFWRDHSELSHLVETERSCPFYH